MSQTNDRLVELGINSLLHLHLLVTTSLRCRSASLYLSGAICFVNGEMTHTGKIGESRDIAYGQAAARVCALNLLAVANEQIGDLDKISRIVQLNGFVNGIPGFSIARQ